MIDTYEALSEEVKKRLCDPGSGELRCADARIRPLIQIRGESDRLTPKDWALWHRRYRR